MGYKSPGVLLEVVVIKREVKALALNFARGKRGCVTILCPDRTQQFKFDRAFGAIILAIKSYYRASILRNVLIVRALGSRTINTLRPRSPVVAITYSEIAHGVCY